MSTSTPESGAPGQQAQQPPPTQNGTHRLVGNHAEEVAVGEARVMLAPGDFVTLSSTDEESNAYLIDSGTLATIADLSKEGG